MVTMQQKLASSGLLNHPSLLKVWWFIFTHYITFLLLQLCSDDKDHWCQSPNITAYVVTSDCSENLERARQIENFHHHFPK